MDPWYIDTYLVSGRYDRAKQVLVWYKENYPQLSPEGEIKGSHFTDSTKEAVWRFSPQYRLGLIKDQSRLIINHEE